MNKIDIIIHRVVHWFLTKTRFGSGKTEENLEQFVKFGIVGVSNTIISYLIYAVTLVILRHFGLFTGTDYIVSQIVMFILSVLWSFFWNNKYVFKLNAGEHRSIWKSLAKTYISYSFTGLFLNSFLLVLWVRLLGISEFIAPLLNLIISVPINFMINKYWAFKKSASNGNDKDQDKEQ